MICVKNLELLQILLDEYDEIRINLEKELTETGKSGTIYKSDKTNCKDSGLYL